MQEVIHFPGLTAFPAFAQELGEPCIVFVAITAAELEHAVQGVDIPSAPKEPHGLLTEMVVLLEGIAEKRCEVHRWELPPIATEA